MAEAYRRAGVAAQVMPFLYDMPDGASDADLVVARAGAMTVAELTACGKPAILIPLPTAIYDHQTRNAKVMEAAWSRRVAPAVGVDRLHVGPHGGDDSSATPERLRAMSEASLIDAADRCGRGHCP